MLVVREEPYGCEERVFTTWVLENAYVRARVVPDLGGGVLQLEHRPNAVDVFGGPGALPVPERGCSLLAPARGPSQAPSLTSADAAADVPEDEHEPGRVVVAGLLPGSPMGVQIVWSLAPDRADLGVEITIRNRSLDTLEPCWSALSLTLGRGRAFHAPQGGAWLAVDDEGTGFAVFADPHRVRAGRWHDGRLEVGRSHASRTLLPRRAEQWGCRVLPLVGVRAPIAAGEGCVLGLVGRAVYVVSATALEGRMFVRDAAGQTLEAPLALRPGALEVFELPCEPTALSVRDSEGVTRLHWTQGEGLLALGDVPPESPFERSFDDSLTVAYLEGAALRASGKDPAEPLARAADAPEWEALSHLQMAMHALSKADFDATEVHLDAALSTNAEDPLLWWFRAAAARLSGRSDEAAPDLPNAHYLAPLEPVLRAEAFLAQPATLEGAPNPLLAPLAAHPDHAIEAASLLVEARLWEDAARLIDELLRHGELSALRLLLAYAHHEATRMRAEVAQQLAHLDPFVGPVPWRSVERRAVAVLREAFPDHRALDKL